MKKHSKIFFLLIIFIFLTTFYPKKLYSPENLKNEDFFIIKNIEILNNDFVSDLEINSNLKQIYGKNIFLLKASDFKDSLYKIDFIEKVDLKKKYPDTIKIKVYEEKPIAIINKKSSKFFVSETSKLISFNENFTYNNLPIVFGEDAELHLVNFIKLLKKNKFPISTIKEFYFFKIGRWDIQLRNKQVIKLPFTKVEESISQLNLLLNHKDFKKYKVIDLRISDKIITE